MTGRPAHLAVVDDEPEMRRVLDEYLTLNGFRVSACDGGRALRALLLAGPVDLIVLDLHMPEEDGLSIIRDVKATTRIPVILLTAASSPIDRVVGLELGGDDYLAKPCELRELLARVRSVLRRSVQPGPGVVQRHLAAIASLDLVGFGRLLQQDEPGTLAALERLFGTVIEPSAARHGGTLFKTTGDGALIEYASVVDAVGWGIDVQTSLANSGGATGREQPLRFRLGIAIGDIVLAGTDRVGEGVALAVRVQEIGEPGRVTISDFTHQLVRARIGQTFVDRGERQLKNIAEPMRVWDWSPDAQSRSGFPELTSAHREEQALPVEQCHVDRDPGSRDDG